MDQLLRVLAIICLLYSIGGIATILFFRHFPGLSSRLIYRVIKTIEPQNPNLKQEIDQILGHILTVFVTWPAMIILLLSSLTISSESRE